MLSTLATKSKMRCFRFQKQIVAEVKESEVYSVLADETKDLQKKNTFL